MKAGNLKMKTIYDYDGNYEEFLALPDDESVLIKGACHAFALELYEWFMAQGNEAHLYYATSDGDVYARHVFVKMSAFYWDVYGRNTAYSIAKRWAESDESRIRQVEHTGWISVAKPNSKTSFLGLIVETKFLELARARARIFIQANPERYTLPF